jgi:hypothetical protein
MTWVVKILGGILGTIVGGLFGFAVSVLLKIIAMFGLLAIGFYGESMPLSASYFALVVVGFCILLYMAGVGFYQVINWITKEIEMKERYNG